jgi:hypothetical protein
MTFLVYNFGTKVLSVRDNKEVEFLESFIDISKEMEKDKFYLKLTNDYNGSFTILTEHEFDILTKKMTKKRNNERWHELDELNIYQIRSSSHHLFEIDRTYRKPVFK